MNRRTPLLFAASALLFGTSFVGIKAVIGSVPPVLFAAYRLDLGALVLVAFVLASRLDWRPRGRADVLAIAVATLFVVVANNVLLFVGQLHTTSGAAAVMYSLMPVAAPVFAVFLLKERLAPVGVAGLLLGLVGVVIIAQPTPSDFAGPGQLLVVVAAMCVAFGTVAMRRIGPSLPTLSLTAWAMLVGAPVVHLTSLALGEPQSVEWTPRIVAGVLYVGIPATAGAYPAYFALLARVGPVKGNLVAYVVPAVATLVGWLALGEAVAPTTGVGFLVIVAGFALLQREPLVRTLRRWGLLDREDVPVLASDGGRVRGHLDDD